MDVKSYCFLKITLDLSSCRTQPMELVEHMELVIKEKTITSAIARTGRLMTIALWVISIYVFILRLQCVMGLKSIFLKKYIKGYQLSKIAKMREL